MSDLFSEITSFPFMLSGIFSETKIVQKWPKERKTQRLKMIADTGYGQIFFENEPLLAKLQAYIKLYGSY